MIRYCPKDDRHYSLPDAQAPCPKCGGATEKMQRPKR